MFEAEIIKLSNDKSTITNALKEWRYIGYLKNMPADKCVCGKSITRRYIIKHENGKKLHVCRTCKNMISDVKLVCDPQVSSGINIKLPQSFKTKKALRNYTRALINSVGICNSIRSVDEKLYIYFCELFKGHPNYPDKVVGMVDIMIRKNSINSKCYELWMIRENGTKEDISWTKSVSRRESNDLVEAYRVAVEPQIFKYKNNVEDLKCVICGSGNNIHVDHVVPFVKLYKQFESTYKINKPRSFDDYVDNRACFKPRDADYENAWKQFHETHAELQILCRGCNLRKSDKIYITFNDSDLLYVLQCGKYAVFEIINKSLINKLDTAAIYKSRSNKYYCGILGNEKKYINRIYEVKNKHLELVKH